MFSITGSGLALLIFIIFVLHVRGKGKNGVIQDPLTDWEELLVWLFSFGSPILAPLIMYFAWKKNLPVKATRVRKITYMVLGIIAAFIILAFIFIVAVSSGGSSS